MGLAVALSYPLLVALEWLLTYSWQYVRRLLFVVYRAVAIMAVSAVLYLLFMWIIEHPVYSPLPLVRNVIVTSVWSYLVDFFSEQAQMVVGNGQAALNWSVTHFI